MGPLFETLRNLGPMRLTVMGGVTLGLLGFFIYLMTRFATPDMALLYSDLAAQDSGRIVKELESQNVPFVIERDGAAIMVPSDQVLRLRMGLAEQGLPAGGTIGYELFDQADSLGTTDFLQNVNLVRALEGELSRTIGSLAQVKTARVHLVLPKRELFSRQSREPSASVVIKMRGPQRLGKEQVQAVQQLVASSVPQLRPDRVSIIDDKGTLLARGFEDQGSKMENMEERRLAYENRLARTIEEMLERTVGFGKVRAEVNAVLNFDSITTTEENYDPDGQVVRSTHTMDHQAQNQDSASQPVTVGNNLPDPTNTGQGEGSSSTSKEARTEETVNYEITKKVVSRTREAGTVERLSVGVLVDGNYATDTEGKQAYQARSEIELKQLATLVKSVIGFEGDRGDTVEVVNLQFAKIEAVEEPILDMIWGFTKQELLKALETVVILVVFVLFVLLVVRPIFSRFFEQMGGALAEGPELLAGRPGAPALAGPGAPPVPSEDKGIAEDELDELIDIDRVEGRVKASSVKKVGEIVEKHPEEALAIIRNWMYQEG